MVDQIETHLRWQQKRMHAFLASRGIVHESYAPLGKDQPGFMDAPELIQIADKYHRTPAQVVLRFLNQEDIVVIPKILNPKHMVENLALFDFELDSADLHVLEGLDRKQALDGWPESMQEDNY